MRKTTYYNPKVDFLERPIKDPNTWQNLIKKKTM